MNVVYFIFKKPHPPLFSKHVPGSLDLMAGSGLANFWEIQP